MDQLIRTRDYLKKKANKTGSEYLHQAFQQIRNKVKYGIRKLRSESLTDIFNASLESNTFLDDLKIAGVTTIFKDGERNDLQNYQPISILCTGAWVFEKLIY